MADAHFNDHSADGCLEVLQNLFLDFSEAGKGKNRDYKEQWAVCEGLGLFFSTEYGSEVYRYTIVLIGRLFLSMLARLEQEKLLSKDSEAHSLGLIMGLFVGVEENMGFTLEAKEELLEPKTAKKEWSLAKYANYIVAYARKYDIQIRGPSGLEELVAQAPAIVELPSNTGKTDPCGFDDALKAYSLKNACVLDHLSKRRKQGTTLIGGDALDITTWTAAERKEASYRGNDPVSQGILDILKADNTPSATRWAAISNPANLDRRHLRTIAEKPIDIYDYRLICSPPFGEYAICDEGETCLCEKPAAAKPDHIWKYTAAGKYKRYTMRVVADMRDPDLWRLSTFNDNACWGTVEVIQNYFLDFEEVAGRDYKEQIDDVDTLKDTIHLMGRLFRCMLARLERERLLSKDSEILNLGLIMALFIAMPNMMPAALELSTENEWFGPEKDNKR
ncbi:hypothetical protein B0T14DRAFT_569032 [Immersiella caudata]|uniref:Uncharacterized protein n=1 Tax=Immersiella caudata TaxID=314043 RepID=A0AA40BXT3_9PEZI|nr:hypothetical protein B0T14DRAFT_569032 [Immersiella caudata]